MPKQRAIETNQRHLAYVPALIGAPNIRAEELPAQPVREQQHLQTMIEGDLLVNQHLLQYEQQQNWIYDQHQVMRSNRPDVNAPMDGVPQGPPNAQFQGPDRILHQQKQVVFFGGRSRPTRSNSGYAALIEEIMAEIIESTKISWAENQEMWTP